MREYIICTIFWGLFTIFIYSLGNVLIKRHECQAYKFVAGYVVYSIGVAIPGVIIQVVNAPWYLFQVYLIALITLLVCIIVRKKIKEGKVFSCSIVDFLKENIILIFTWVTLSFMLLFYFRMFWEGNHLDDGYYITKVATLPQSAFGFRMNYAVGVAYNTIDSYVLNTWELEASVFVEMLGVHSTLYLRFFQSIFNYLVCLNCILAFSSKIFANLKGKAKNFEAQFPIGAMPLLFLYDLFAEGTNLFYVSDMTQNNTAMYYGGALVKVISIFLLLVFYLEEKKISFKMIGGVIGIGVVLISKSSIALPLIVVVSVSYLFVTLLMSKVTKAQLTAVVIMIVYLLAAIILPNGENRQSALYTLSLQTVTSVVMIVCCVIFVASFVWLRERIIYKLNCIMLLVAILMFTPQVNDVFETFCIYGFVAGRAWDTWAYTFVAVNMIYLYLLIRRFGRIRVSEVVFAGIVLTLPIVQVAGYGQYGGELYISENSPVKGNLREAVETIYQNHYFFPDTTLVLCDCLERIYHENEKEELRVVSPDVVGVDYAYHTLPVQLRIYAPHIISVSAVERYSKMEDSELQSYTQDAYENFVEEPTKETAEAFRKIVDTYQVNCVVMTGNETEEYLQEMGFELYEYVGNYYFVWYKK